MPATVEKPTNLVKPPEEIEECDETFQSQDETSWIISRICYGDLYLIGKIWINVLRTILVGAKVSVIPTVDASVKAAAVIDKGPEKPRKMRPSELPIYECPHQAYQEYQEDKIRCPQYKKKLIHSMVQPHVKKCRQVVQNFVCSTRCQALQKYCELRCEAKNAKNRFLIYMRDPENLDMRRGVVAVSAGLGFISSGKGIPRKLIWTGFGAATAGMICFPKETDEYIRTICYYTGQALVFSYNTICSKEIKIEEPVCRPPPNLPEVTPQSKVKCPPKP